MALVTLLTGVTFVTRIITRAQHGVDVFSAQTIERVIILVISSVPSLALELALALFCTGFRSGVLFNLTLSSNERQLTVGRGRMDIHVRLALFSMEWHILSVPMRRERINNHPKAISYFIGRWIMVVTMCRGEISIRMMLIGVGRVGSSKHRSGNIMRSKGVLSSSGCRKLLISTVGNGRSIRGWRSILGFS